MSACARLITRLPCGDPTGALTSRWGRKVGIRTRQRCSAPPNGAPAASGRDRWRLILALSFLAMSFSNSKLLAEDIVLGMSAAFTGPSRGLGIELYRGSMACFEHVNRSGGVHGRKITIKAYDDGYDPDLTVKNTTRLIHEDNAFLLYGYVGTPTVVRMLPLLKLHSHDHVYLFCAFTGSQPQRRPPYDEFAFNLRASFHQETGETVENLLRIGRKRIAVFYQIDSFGRGGWDGVRTALAKHGLSIVEEATYSRGITFSADLRPQVTILRQAEPDAVICVAAHAASAAFIRDARDAGWDVPITNVAFVGSESLLALLETHGKANGRDYTRNLINSQVVPSYYRTDLPAINDYREMMNRYKPMPEPELVDPDYRLLPYSYVGLEGFLNARLLVEVFKQMGKTLDKRRLPEVMESIDRLDLGIDVPASFGPKKHQGLDKVYFATVDEGRFARLADWNQWRK